MDTAISAIEYSETAGAYDQVIVNDDLEKAYGVMKGFLQESFPELLNVHGGAGDA